MSHIFFLYPTVRISSHKNLHQKKKGGEEKCKCHRIKCMRVLTVWEWNKSMWSQERLHILHANMASIWHWRLKKIKKKWIPLEDHDTWPVLKTSTAAVGTFSLAKCSFHHVKKVQAFLLQQYFSAQWIKVSATNWKMDVAVQAKSQIITTLLSNVVCSPIYLCLWVAAAVCKVYLVWFWM